jgi:hypothetical protein
MSKTHIQDIPEDPRERLRREILANVEGRRVEAQQAFLELVKYVGIILSGGTIAILGFIGSRKDSPIPAIAIASLLSFIASILSFSVFLYLHYLLHQTRWHLYADAAQKFFLRKVSLEEMINLPEQLRSRWLYRLGFFVPLAFAALGFILGAIAAFSLTNSYPGALKT